jgi:hypothetical protein
MYRVPFLLLSLWSINIRVIFDAFCHCCEHSTRAIYNCSLCFFSSYVRYSISDSSVYLIAAGLMFIHCGLLPLTLTFLYLGFR